jgi:hypothetical protein
MAIPSPHHSPLIASTEAKRAQALEHFRLIRPFLEEVIAA